MPGPEDQDPRFQEDPSLTHREMEQAATTRLESSKPRHTPVFSVKEQVKNAFTYHAPKEDQRPRYESIRDQVHEVAKYLLANTPPGREQSLALTKLEEAVMWANAAIARGE